MGMPRAIIRPVYILAVAALCVACSTDTGTQTRQVGDYFITVTTDPPKLQIGGDAEVTAHIGKDDDGVESCRVGFRQYMPDHQMTTDRAVHAMNGIGQGLYRGRGSEFSVAGNWELEVQFNCGDGLKTAVFNYQLVWM